MNFRPPDTRLYSYLCKTKDSALPSETYLENPRDEPQLSSLS